MSDLDWSELNDLRQLKESHLREIKRLRGIEDIVKRLITWPSLTGTQEWCELKAAIDEERG